MVSQEKLKAASSCAGGGSLSDVAIRVEGLGKRYRIGLLEEEADTLVEAVGRWVRAPFRNYRRLRRLSRFDEEHGEDVLWALRDVSFEVERGEVVGMIGRNGAGKSTLLKILAGITEPSEGRATLEGRVASLLEVGTGFHPELTGRENVYLNGTILGMTRKEVDRKFDEITDFSGVAKFMETPVKRYSSGMKVRLAFAVAAHLDPEILLVDEVLAVGDVEFQRRCLEKMDSIVDGGRTVLFVSHDMKAIQQLCPRALVLDDGSLTIDADVETAITRYVIDSSSEIEETTLAERPRERNEYGSEIRLERAALFDSNGKKSQKLKLGESFTVEAEFSCRESLSSISVVIGIDSVHGVEIVTCVSDEGECLFSCESGDTLVVQATFVDLPLNTGDYLLRIGVRTMKAPLDLVRDAVRFSVLDILSEEGTYHQTLKGLVRCVPQWSRGNMANTCAGLESAEGDRR